MKIRLKHTIVGALAVAGAAMSLAGTSAPAAAADKFKIFLSMSYIGNDWQAEAANMLTAMAASGPYRDKVDLQAQVAGPNAQRQIQQINAMVQQGADAIIVYPISPTALNQVVKNACDKGVVVVAYDSIIEEPCAYNVHIDQKAWGTQSAEWLVDKLGGKGNVVMVTGVPGTTVDDLRNAGAKAVFAQHPDIKVVAEVNGMWSQAVARTELSKVLATRNWDEIDGLWMQAGCYTANSLQSEAGIADADLRPCAGEASNGGRIQMLPVGTEVEGRQRHLPADGRRALVVGLAELHRRAGAQARRQEARRRRHPGADRRRPEHRHQRERQVLRGRDVAGDEGRLQRLPAGARPQSGLVRLDLLRGDSGSRPQRRPGGPAGILIGA